jgi:integrase
MLDRGLSLKTVRNAHGVMRAALNHAVDEWKLVAVNVARAVRLPQYVPPEHETLSPDEVRQVWQAVEGTRWHAFLILLVMTGLRQGEILGLKWSDIDQGHAILQLRRQLQRDKSFAPTKGKRNRRLDLSDLELAALREHRALQEADRREHGDRYEDRGLIFCTHLGRPLGWRVVDRDFALILKRAGVKTITFHESRHTYATIALKHGIPAKVVQERLGHSDIGVTLNIYSHVVPGIGRQAAEEMGAILGGGMSEDRGQERS